MRKTLLNSLLASALTVSAGTALADEHSIKVGTVAGPETEVMEVAAEIAQREHGLSVEIIEFTDYVTPNAALADGSLDANAYQHEPYMRSMVEDRGYDFAVAGYTFVYPIGAYSEKHDSIDELPEGAQIALPNDPSNEGRALILMHNQGLIELDDPRMWLVEDFSSMQAVQEATYDPEAAVDSATIGVTAERAETDDTPGNRVIAVADAAWATDYITTYGALGPRTAEITGAAFPANGELFVNSVYWLAGTEELIAATPRSQDIRRIGAVSSTAEWWIGGLLVVGLPLLATAGGVAVALVRRAG